MSNWSVVILKWSSLDSLTPGDVVRATSNSETFRSYGQPPEWVVTPAHGDSGASFGARAWVMATHINHFDLQEALVELRNLPWSRSGQCPHSAFLIFQSEQMDGPRVETLFSEVKWSDDFRCWEPMG